MKRQNHNRKKPGGNGNNFVCLLTIICCALLLTVLFNSCASMCSNASTVELGYSTFRQWEREDKVASVQMESGK